MATNKLSVRFSVTGGLETALYLRLLGAKLARGPVKQAVLAAGRLIARTAKQTVPVETGALKDAVGVKGGAFRRGLGYYALVGARKDARNYVTRKRFSRWAVRRSSWSRQVQRVVPHKYLHLVEGGTRRHAVGRGSSLKTGVQFPPWHPGARANPFLRTAAEANRAAVRALLVARLRQAVARKYLGV